MNRAYVIFNTLNGMAANVAQTLQYKPGVIMVDIMEDQPIVIMVVQSRSRQKLAELTVRAAASVEKMTEGMQLMAARPNISHQNATLAMAYRNN